MQENAAKTAAEWVFVAKSIAQLPDGHDQALRLMAHTETLAQDVTDWLAVATAWQQDFGDTERARICMDKAEESERAGQYVKKSEQNMLNRISLAITWEQVFGDRDTAHLWELKAEAFGDIPDLIQLAKIWKNKFQNKDKGIQCLNKAEEKAQSFWDWMQMVEIWKGSFRNRKNGIRCLEEAESVAKNTDDWIYIAKFWERNFRSRSKGAQCLQRAESIAQRPFDWTELAKTWKEDFRDPNSGIRCLEKAESLAENVHHWAYIAISWKTEFGNSDNGIRCLEKAESLAKNAADWIEIGSAWGGTFGNSDNEDRCLRVACGSITPFNMVGAPIAGARARRQAIVGSLGFLGQEHPEKAIINLWGTWGEECLSERLSGYYARHYSFRLSQAAEVTIGLTAEVEAAALFLMSGDIADGAVLDQFGPVSGTAYIKRNLDAGAYAVEAAAIKTGPPGETISFRMIYSIPRIDSHRTRHMSDSEIYTVVGRPNRPAD